MNEQKRSLIAAALSMGVLIGWFYFFNPEKGNPPPVATNQTSSSTASSTPLSVAGSSVMEASNAAVLEEKVSRETPLMHLEWTNRGATLSQISLKNFHETVDPKSPLIKLLSFEGEKAFTLLCEGCEAVLPDDSSFRLVESTDNKIVFQGEKNGLRVRKEYTWRPDQYLFDLRLSFENLSTSDIKGRMGLGWTAKQLPVPAKKWGFLGEPENQRSFLYKLDNKTVHFTEKDEPRDVQGMIPWTGIQDRYFLISIISRQVSSGQFLRLRHEGNFLKALFYQEPVVLPSQGKVDQSYSLYLGPLDPKHLEVAGVGLEKSIDYGWFAPLAWPILKLLQFFQGIVKNWGVAIILLTLFIKILVNPLTLKSMKQMKEMQKLQPRMAEMREKYKNDKQRLNVEMMQLFKTHKVNPIGGCFPMLLQMPIYIVLYKVLYNSIELYHAPFFGFYRDLSAPDPYFILPVLLGVAMVLQQKMTPNPSADPTQKQIMMIMPVMFSAFMLFLPLGLVVYIFINTTTSVLQQWMHQNDILWRNVLRGRFKK